MAALEARFAARTRQEGGTGWWWLSTRRVPRRLEVSAGPSVFWVIEGRIQARAVIHALREDTAAGHCLILLHPLLIRTVPRPHPAFQGWRYLPQHLAPGDLSPAAAEALAALPPGLGRELRRLGLL